MIFSAVYYWVSLERYQTIFAGYLSFAKGRVKKRYRRSESARVTQQKEHLLIWNSETTQNLNIYLYNYQTETAIFLATKHEKQLWHAVI